MHYTYNTFIILYYTYTLLYCTILYLYFTILYCTVLIFYSTILILFHTILYLYYTILIIYYTIPWYRRTEYLEVCNWRKRKETKEFSKNIFSVKKKRKSYELKLAVGNHFESHTESEHLRFLNFPMKQRKNVGRPITRDSFSPSRNPINERTFQTSHGSTRMYIHTSHKHLCFHRLGPLRKSA